MEVTMYMVCVVRQSSVIACYGPFGDRDIANEFMGCYLSHESNVQIVANYGTFSEYANRDEMKNM